MIGLTRIGDCEFQKCFNALHFPPSKETLDTGRYSYSCPACGYNWAFEVRHRGTHWYPTGQHVPVTEVIGNKFVNGPGDPT